MTNDCIVSKKTEIIIMADGWDIIYVLLHNKQLFYIKNILPNLSILFRWYFVYSVPLPSVFIHPSNQPEHVEAYLHLPSSPQSSPAINQQQGFRGQTEEPLSLPSDCLSLSSARRLLLLQMDDWSGSLPAWQSKLILEQSEVQAPPYWSEWEGGQQIKKEDLVNWCWNNGGEMVTMTRRSTTKAITRKQKGG